MHQDFEKMSFQNNDTMGKGFLVSLGAHLLLVAMLIVKSIFWSEPLPPYQSAVRVDIVGLPDKVTPKLTEKTLNPTPTQDISQKDINPIKLESNSAKTQNSDDGINLSKVKDSTKEQQDALNKLKALSAIEKIKDDLSKENKKNTPPAPVRGNILSSGSSLTGIQKIQLEDYQDVLYQNMKNHWYVPEWIGRKKFLAVARVYVDEKGNIIGRKIEKSSGNPTFDESVLKTITDSSPLPAPPNKFTEIAKNEGLLFEFGSEN